MKNQRSWSHEDLVEAVKHCNSMSQLATKLNLAICTTNFNTLKKGLVETGLKKLFDTKCEKAKSVRAHELVFKNQTPFEEVFCKNSKIRSVDVRKRALREGILKNECYECKQGPLWRGKPLTIQVDHINGERFDNRVENLRMLCPNCHTQTETHSGRNKKLKNKALSSNG